MRLVCAMWKICTQRAVTTHRFPCSPMQWDHTTNAGFSAAPKEKLYVKQDEATDRPTVEAQMADPDSLCHEIQKLIGIRQAHSALQSRGD